MRALLFATILFLYHNGFCQSQWSLDSVKVIPESPQNMDSVKVVYFINALSLSNVMSKNSNVNSSTVEVSICLNVGGTQPGNLITDTVLVGALASGVYNLNFTVFGVQHNDCANIQDTVEVFDQFAVDGNLRISEDQNESNNIFPNPVLGQLNLQVSGSEYFFKIYNLDGKIVLQGNSSSNVIPVEFLSKGSYILEVSLGDKLLRNKFLKL
ncbi:MAG: T9SS type A sorting domain-containing protein [Crocinitomicaceae bacterium]